MDMSNQYKDYFNYSIEEKEKLISTVFNNIVHNTKFKKLNMKEEFKIDMKKYENNFKERKIEAIENEQYELCDIIDKVLEKIKNYANT